MLDHRPFIALFLVVLACGALLVPVARSGVLGSLITAPPGFLMFPTVFVSAPVAATPGIIVP
ncbi:MAG: hypothetical protein E6Q76_13390 [Rhizobium sp.]|nr:MAG: hypothetical protein E6Q76_13390 [Rhizobium sp.]